MTIEEKINILPPRAIEEVNDFIDFLIEKYQKEDEKQWLVKMSEKSLDKIWNNPEDDIYNELLQG
jgi:hypothetical protein